MLNRPIRTIALALALLTAALSPPGRALASAPGDDELTLMTFNIRYATERDGENAWPHRRELLARVIRDADPDIVGLQEALRSQLDDLARLLPGYAQVGVGRDDGREAGEHCTILYRADRFDIAAAGDDRGTFWLSDTPDIPGSKSWGNNITRICTWARFIPRERAGDRPPPGFYIFNAHLDHQSQPSRAHAAEFIASRMANRAHPEAPAVLMGDLNAGETNPVVRFLKGEAPRASDDSSLPSPSPSLRCALREADPDAADVGTYHAFRGDRTGELIDYILLPRATTVLSAEIVRTRNDSGRYPSDHFPVLARVRLNSPAPE